MKLEVRNLSHSKNCSDCNEPSNAATDRNFVLHFLQLIKKQSCLMNRSILSNKKVYSVICMQNLITRQQLVSREMLWPRSWPRTRRPIFHQLFRPKFRQQFVSQCCRKNRRLEWFLVPWNPNQILQCSLTLNSVPKKF